MEVSECPSCFATAVVEDTHGVQLYSVCSKCGYVLSDENLTNASSNLEGTSGGFNSDFTKGASKALAVALKKTPSDRANVKECLLKIKTVGQKIVLCESLVERATTLFRKVYADDRIINKRLNVKLAIAACCVYRVARENNRIIAMREFAKIGGISFAAFCKAYKLVKCCLKVDSIAPQKITDVCDHMFEVKNFPRSLKAQVIELLSIFEQTWMSGVTVFHKNIVHLCIFLAWQASHKETKDNLQYKQFCEEFQLDFTPMCKLQVFPHVKKLLLSMGNELAWVENDLQMKDLPWNLDNIIQFKQSLIEKIRKKSPEHEGLFVRVTPKSHYTPEQLENIEKENLKLEEDVVKFKQSFGSLDNPELNKSEFADEMCGLIKK